MIISYLYSWHIVQSALMFDVLNLLADRFHSKDIQLIITALTNCGMMLRYCERQGCIFFHIRQPMGGMVVGWYVAIVETVPQSRD